MKTIENKKIRIALLGLGTVGSGVYEILAGWKANFPIKSALSLRSGKFW